MADIDRERVNALLSDLTRIREEATRLRDQIQDQMDALTRRDREQNRAVTAGQPTDPRARSRRRR